MMLAAGAKAWFDIFKNNVKYDSVYNLTTEEIEIVEGKG